MTQLIEFPTLRDDDALFYTAILNPHLEEIRDSEEIFFADVLEYSRIFGQRFRLTLHGDHFKEEPEDDFELNAYGLALAYEVPESRRWDRGVLQQAGAEVVRQLLDGEDDLTNAVASLVLNVRPDPVHFLDLRLQGVYTDGVDGLDEIVASGDLARAKSLAGYSSLRYLYRRYERPTAQVSVMAGYRNYPDLAADSSQGIIAANALYRIGAGFDIGLQVIRQSFDGNPADLFGNDETVVQAFLTWEFDQSWNRQFDDRDSLLNLQHGYIP
jgi:hypothetical protein